MVQKIGELMTPGVETIAPDDSVKHAAVRMEALDIGPLPVCDGDRLIGIITDRDITVRAVASGRDPNVTRVAEIMTAEVAYCYEDQDVEEAGQIMKQNEIRRLPVLNREGRLVGMVSLGDIAVHGRDTDVAGDVLKRVSAAEPDE